MSASSWLSLLAVCVLGAISPGPSLAAVMKNTVQGSRLHGIVAAVSHAIGIGLYTFLVAAGLALVITETPWLLHFMTYAGASYLIWMGYKAITSKTSIISEQGVAGDQLSLKQSAIDGFLISFLNPKIAVFFLALFSQFVNTESTLTTKLLMALLATLCDVIWYVIVACIAGHGKILPALRKRALLVNRLCGGLLIIVALRILVL